MTKSVVIYINVGYNRRIQEEHIDKLNTWKLNGTYSENLIICYSFIFEFNNELRWKDSMLFFHYFVFLLIVVL